MHILFIHQAFVSHGGPGGTRHYELFRNLMDCGHQVTTVASSINPLTGQRTNPLGRSVVREDLDGIRVSYAYTYPSLHRSFIWRVLSFLSFMVTSIVKALRARSVDLVLGTSPPIFQCISSWLVSTLYGRPFILEIRDLWPEFAIDIGVLKNKVLIYLSCRLERFLYARANHIIVNSPAYKDYLLNKGVPGDKITVIPNGVDTDMFRPDIDGKDIRKQWHLDGKFIVTYAGALGLANDIPTILKAASLLRENSRIHFLIVGDGKERSNLEEMGKELRLRNVTFTGSKPKIELPQILAASDACVATLQNIPMFRTTYPNKVFDHMAAGRPTILAIDGVIRDVVEAARGGIFVPPGNAVALSEAVERLCENPELACQMGSAARSHVVQYFDRRIQARQLAELVEQLGGLAGP